MCVRFVYRRQHCVMLLLQTTCSICLSFARDMLLHGSAGGSAAWWASRSFEPRATLALLLQYIDRNKILNEIVSGMEKTVLRPCLWVRMWLKRVLIQCMMVRSIIDCSGLLLARWGWGWDVPEFRDELWVSYKRVSFLISWAIVGF
jgi:hypothetical protein